MSKLRELQQLINAESAETPPELYDALLEALTKLR